MTQAKRTDTATLKSLQPVPAATRVALLRCLWDGYAPDGSPLGGDA
jgi:hypothetical protein